MIATDWRQLAHAVREHAVDILGYDRTNRRRCSAPARHPGQQHP